MNPSQLLKYFDRISDAPGVVTRLRSFILDLAVRGKLTAQDLTDEPASELLKRIQTEKERLAKANGFRQETLPPIDPRELPFDLPRSWEWTRIGWVFKYDAGTKREPRELEPNKWLLELEDIEKDTSVVHTRLRAKDRDSRSTKSEFRTGDILYGKLRPYLNKVVVADNDGYSTTEIVAIRPFIAMNSSYCCLAFRRPDFVKYVNRVGRGTKMPRLRTQDALFALFPLPPIAEQHRIVAKVDELMDLCDRLEVAQAERETRRNRLAAASLHRLNKGANAETLREHAGFYLKHLPCLTSRPEQIKLLRKTILNLAIRGQLVPQDPNDAPASKLVERIQAEKARLEAAGILKKSKPVPPVGRDEMFWALPSGWEWCRLRLLVFSLGDGLHGTPNYVDGTNCYFVNGNNLVDGMIVIKPNTKTVSFDEMQKHKKPLSSNTVLVSINGTLGNIAFYKNEKVVLGKSACYFNLSESIDKRFVKLVIQSQYFIDYALQNATGTTIKNLSLKAMNEFPVPLPPEAEQRRIVAKVDELMPLCERMETQLTSAQTENSRFLEAVIHAVLNEDKIHVA